MCVFMIWSMAWPHLCRWHCMPGKSTWMKAKRQSTLHKWERLTLHYTSLQGGIACWEDRCSQSACTVFALDQQASEHSRHKEGLHNTDWACYAISSWMATRSQWFWQMMMSSVPVEPCGTWCCHKCGVRLHCSLLSYNPTAIFVLPMEYVSKAIFKWVCEEVDPLVHIWIVTVICERRWIIIGCCGVILCMNIPDVHCNGEGEMFDVFVVMISLPRASFWCNTVQYKDVLILPGDSDGHVVKEKLIHFPWARSSCDPVIPVVEEMLVDHVDVSYVRLEVLWQLAGPVAVLFQVKGMSARNIGREEKEERWMTDEHHFMHFRVCAKCVKDNVVVTGKKVKDRECYVSWQIYVKVKGFYLLWGRRHCILRTRLRLGTRDEGTESQPDELWIRKTDAVIV